MHFYVALSPFGRGNKTAGHDTLVSAHCFFWCFSIIEPPALPDGGYTAYVQLMRFGNAMASCTLASCWSVMRIASV